MISLDLAKNYLRIDYDDDDELIKLLINSVDLFLNGAITDFEKIKESDAVSSKIKILELAVLQELYDNRGMNLQDYKPSRVINSMIYQLDLGGE